MNIFESSASGSSIEWSQVQQAVAQQRCNNLKRYEEELMNEQDEHPWWSFFDSGIQDEEGAVWSVYNRWCDETKTHGWRVVRCPSDRSDFSEIPVSRVVRQEVYPAAEGREGLTTFQLSIRSEAAGLTNNDVLNVLLYYSDDTVRPKLHLWNQAHTMTAVEVEPFTVEVDAYKSDHQFAA